MISLRRLSAQPWFQRIVGVLVADFLRLVWFTNRFVYRPEKFYERYDPPMPIILAFWHGQHFMTPFVRRSYHRAKVMVSRHRDGEINAIAAERLGVGTIRGSGDHGGDFHRKGGVSAYLAMVRALADGWNVAMTADVPKVSRKAGLGIITLAKQSGRPIAPFAIATSRFIRLNNWDHSTLHMPFGRGAMVGRGLIYVPADADDAAMEGFRIQLENELNLATQEAYALVGRGGAEPGHG